LTGAVWGLFALLNDTNDKDSQEIATLKVQYRKLLELQVMKDDGDPTIDLIDDKKTKY
jgi:hypothetical protein